VQKVSIIPRSIGALGYTMQRPTGDRYLMTQQELQNKMCVLLGGRAAETEFFDDISTGASDDLQKTTDIARSMATQYGMTEKLGQLAYESRQQSAGGLPLAAQERKSYSEETARDIDVTARALVDAAFQRSLEIVRGRHDQLDRCARALLEQETMDEADLRSYFGIAEKKTATGEARRRSSSRAA
jgi:cell division protease FtsH